MIDTNNTTAEALDTHRPRNDAPGAARQKCRTALWRSPRPSPLREGRTERRPSATEVTGSRVTPSVLRTPPARKKMTPLPPSISAQRVEVPAPQRVTGHAWGASGAPLPATARCGKGAPMSATACQPRPAVARERPCLPCSACLFIEHLHSECYDCNLAHFVTIYLWARCTSLVHLAPGASRCGSGPRPKSGKMPEKYKKTNTFVVICLINLVGTQEPPANHPSRVRRSPVARPLPGVSSLYNSGFWGRWPSCCERRDPAAEPPPNVSRDTRPVGIVCPVDGIRRQIGRDLNSDEMQDFVCEGSNQGLTLARRPGGVGPAPAPKSRKL